MHLSKVYRGSKDNTEITGCGKRQSKFMLFPGYVEFGVVTNLQVATVTNFPHGNPDVSQAVSETEEAVKGLSVYNV